MNKKTDKIITKMCYIDILICLIIIIVIPFLIYFKHSTNESYEEESINIESVSDIF